MLEKHGRINLKWTRRTPLSFCDRDFNFQHCFFKHGKFPAISFKTIVECNSKFPKLIGVKIALHTSNPHGQILYDTRHHECPRTSIKKKQWC